MGRRTTAILGVLQRGHVVGLGAAVLGAAVLAAVGIARGFDATMARWTVAGVVTALAATFGLGFVAIARRGGMPWRMLAAAALVHLGAVATAARIFGAVDLDGAAIVDPWIATAAIVGIAAIVNGAMLVHRAPAPSLSALRWVPVVLGWLGALGLLDALWGGLLTRIPQDVVVFVLAGGSAALLGLAVLGAIAVGLASRAVASRRALRPESIAPGAGIEIGCPRCGASAVRPIGLSRCAACGEPLEILVEEPRCACGYLLGLAAGATCPECGRPVTAARGA